MEPSRAMFPRRHQERTSLILTSSQNCSTYVLCASLLLASYPTLSLPLLFATYFLTNPVDLLSNG